MNSIEIETLSALVDGERVDPERLADALGAEGSHAALVDFAMLRHQLRRAEDVPGETFYTTLSPLLIRREGPRRGSWLKLVGAAAVGGALAIALLAPRWGQEAPLEKGPPEPDRVVRLEPSTGRVQW